jgi:hypothetical protein
MDAPVTDNTPKASCSVTAGHLSLIAKAVASALSSVKRTECADFVSIGKTVGKSLATTAIAGFLGA